MKKTIAMLCAAALMLCVSCGALAAGVTIRTFTPFADLDGSAQSYMDMITAWEAETGNVVEDYSGLTDEAWIARMTQMVKAGEADVLVIPQGTGLGKEELVTVEELYAAVPDLGVRRFSALSENGSVVLSPLRMSWEALYVNTDVLAAYGLAVPTTYEELIGVCSVLAQKGVTPIANALCDWPEIVLDCLALAGAAPEEFGGEASLAGAQQMLAALLAVGAFGDAPAQGTDYDTMQAFLAGDAAMRFDSDFLAYDVPDARLDSVMVISMPRRAGESSAVLPGTPGFSVAITRSCWEDDARCEAALALVRAMLSGQNYQNLAVGVGGRLGESIADMLLQATDCAGILYDVMEGSYDGWAQALIASMVQ